jgi:hypothetical protein
MDLQASRNATSTPCLFVEPAPITQMSMQTTGILPG